MLHQLLSNDWDGMPQRMTINLGALVLGWGGIAVTHTEFNLWVQTIASLIALFILIWNFWGSVKEARRRRIKDDKNL
jgi:membrane protein implicated in regulation of membrane protease activity